MQDRNIFETTRTEETLIDDPGYSRTRSYTTSLQLLRLLSNSLVRNIETWERFETGEIQYFRSDNATLREAWDRHLAEIQRDVNQLLALRRKLQQKIETIDSMRNGASKDVHFGSPFLIVNSWSMLLRCSRA